MPVKQTFRVIHASGQDDHHKAVELNNHSPVTKGWHSSRFCLYPQDLVIQLNKRSRLRKLQILSHQYLIATKIEFYVGDVPDGTTVSLQNARYTRLGYVALSDNEKTGFKARELKSVHVDAVGHFIKLVIHKNHVNRHNLYNQVGLVAINVIGDDVLDHPDVRQAEIAFLVFMFNERDPMDPSLAGLYNRPDYISPLDDLAFDMYQDPEIAQIIRKLEKKKQDAVLDEKYDYAKKLKSAIQDLQKVGEKLGKYEVEKRQAVENEDYDKAKLKKVQMDEYRLQVYKDLELNDLLDQDVLHASADVVEIPEFYSDPYMQKTSPRMAEIVPSPQPLPHSPDPYTTPSPRTPYDERPLPAIKSLQGQPVQPPSMLTNVLCRRLRSNVTGEPEPMIEKDQREAAIVIDTFGLPLASKSYSKTWSFREDALLEVYKEMTSASTNKDEARNMMRAAVFLSNRAIKDKVLAVYTAGLNLLKMILTQFIPDQRLQKQDTAYAVEKTMPALLQRTGDTAIRCREAAKNFILEESGFSEVKPLHVVPHECVRPIKLSLAPRLALSRTEVLELLYKTHGVENSGLTVENMMNYCTQALQHNAGEVREKAEKVIILLYKDVGSPVKDFLPPDVEKTRRNVLYKQLFEAFDRIDGKPSKDDQKVCTAKTKMAEEKKKAAEIDQLQKQLQQLKDITAGKAKEKKSRAKPSKHDNKPKEDADFQIDHTCIFCGEKNSEFSEEGLDLHYWKNCPMLKRCSFCKQVVEIAGLTDHLVSECENKANFGKCPRCKEAVPKAELDQHLAEKSCTEAEAGKNHCPLCHLNLPSGEDSWKEHLMGKEGCKANPRRLQSLNKGKGAAPKAKSRALPVKANQGKSRK
ncbi:hypothetical protein CAPTEDRAFT_170133 [Capitella teleta]|uniref:Centrosomal protein of 104 kDa n=1 Tax=Capitella teleta TaxID=283909 RepID=R7TP87_CAPTE|nr:hypothetical protein CAPTEDRAFT_170133 [Capitella teleta]|eukprot:ELT95484.1 hypothetical protein CAPTEDRAFT_170133 [Capitella teleta]